MSNKVDLRIRGQEFSLKSDHDPEYLREVASFVDSKIEDIYQRTKIVDTHKLILLTAINIADDLFQIKEKLSKIQGEVEGRVDSLITLLDRTL